MRKLSFFLITSIIILSIINLKVTESFGIDIEAEINTQLKELEKMKSEQVKLDQELKKIEDQNRIREVIDLVGLNGYESYYPYQLSGGLKQRVSIARALVLNPQVILMDEPFSSLDEFTREELNVQLLKIQKKFRQTIIFITHNLEEAVFLSRRVIILTKTPGSILAEVNIDLPYNRSLGLKSKPEFYKHIIEVREKMRAGC